MKLKLFFGVICLLGHLIWGLFAISSTSSLSGGIHSFLQKMLSYIKENCTFMQKRLGKFPWPAVHAQLPQCSRVVSSKPRGAQKAVPEDTKYCRFHCSRMPRQPCSTSGYTQCLTADTESLETSALVALGRGEEVMI